MNVLITGAAGFIGSQLVTALQQHEEVNNLAIIATDIKEQPPFALTANTEYVPLDIRSPELSDLIHAKQIDIIVHLASIVTPGKKSNRQFEYSVDVGGTKNVLQACIEHNVKRIIVTSSGAAYGYYADNSEWISEEHDIRGNEAFAYAYHKRLVEEMLANYREKYPQLQQTIFRVGTILGENVNNQITALFEKRFVIGVRGSDSPFVFIWDKDVVNCLQRAIFSEQTGIFNVAGDGALTIDDIGTILGKKVIRIPVSLLTVALFILKRLRLTQYGEEQIDFLRYRPVLANEKLKREFSYKPLYTSEEAFRKYCEHKWLS